ncbi:elongation of very long chain fatty acids protein 6-like [Oppia nitens]|uniref:elongation of very long chain fatty acids protein 6-like n=1 Tax=Oppia nitens TaxID=1686743 RepID=UPI0023DB5747|nr:elongation of very long chain fatty acids protein 6-like [Oppia nitens]
MSTQLAPNYSFVFDFERHFDPKPRAQWMSANWTTAVYWITAYLIVVFGGQHLMATRKPYKLRTALVVWNTCLALFSIVGTLRTLPELVHVISWFGFSHSVCSNSYHTSAPISSCWTFLFICSKAPELGDTVFVVLRKQRLLFLHWYHHVTVLLFTWYSYADEASSGRWYVDMNYVVHAIMYSYYAVRAAGLRPPRFVAIAITASQILQMAVGTFVTVFALRQKMVGHACRVSDSVLYAGIAMYSSYLVLFGLFFRDSYLSSKNRIQRQKTQ